MSQFSPLPAFPGLNPCDCYYYELYTENILKKSYPIRYLSRSLPILRWARTILRNIDSTVVRFEPKPFGCQTEPLPLHSECLCTVLPILSIYSQLGYIGFSPAPTHNMSSNVYKEGHWLVFWSALGSYPILYA